MADHERTKMRSEKEFKSLMTRLKKIEGQIRGIEGMLEKNAYCPDILIQVSAVSSALYLVPRPLRLLFFSRWMKDVSPL